MKWNTKILEENQNSKEKYLQTIGRELNTIKKDESV
jgi:hypothetical protein